MKGKDLNARLRELREEKQKAYVKSDSFQFKGFLPPDKSPYVLTADRAEVISIQQVYSMRPPVQLG